MADTDAELHDRFERYAASKDGKLPPEILGELQSMLRIFYASPEDLYFKWEAYTMKMGGEDLKLDLKTARDFKKHVQDILERESKVDKKIEKRAAPTPKAGADVFGM